MHGGAFLDGKGEPVCNAIIWADSRSKAECSELEEILGKARLSQILLNRIFPGTFAGTIRWMQKNDKTTWGKVRHLLSPKDYLRFRMCGLYNSDSSDSSATLLFDVGKRDWSNEVLKLLNMPLEFLPFIVNSNEHVAETEGIFDETGIPDGIPVIIGGADQGCSLLGNGVLDEGSMLVTIGTGGQLSASSATPRVSPGLSLTTFCHLPENRWYVMGATLSAGLSLRWFKDTFFPGTGFDELASEASKAPLGSEGLIFAPYLAGKRSPDLNPDATGTFHGITLKHAKGHFVRAIMEGVIYDLRENLDMMKTMGLAPEKITGAGGAMNSRLWTQILADIFGCPIMVSSQKEASCIGAALVAGIGVKMFRNYKEAAELLPAPTEQIDPITENVTLYEEKYRKYLSLYEALKK